MCCVKCGSKNVVNKHFKLCLGCNNIRLYGNKFGKKYNHIKNKKQTVRSSKKSLFVNGIKKNKINKIGLDEEFYLKCFNLSDHKCEECGEPLPDVFEIDGKVIAKWRYSHVIPKSIAPHIRHNIKNINHLCLKHHRKWENGDKKSMKIYEKNVKNFPQYFD